jgi:hypothetical protein
MSSRALHAAMTERELQRTVVDLAFWLGYELVYHTWSSINSPSGFPDLCLCRPSDSTIIFIELKSERGKVTPTQEAWLRGLKECGMPAYVFRPADWFSGAIEKALVPGGPRVKT